MVYTGDDIVLARNGGLRGVKGLDPNSTRVCVRRAAGCCGPKGKIRNDCGNCGSALSRVWNIDVRRNGLVRSDAFVIGGEEGLVFDDGPSRCGSKLGAAKGRNNGTVKVIARVEDFVAIENVRGSVELVGSRFCYGVYNCPEVRPYSEV